MSKSHAASDRHAHRHRTDVHATRRVLWIALSLTLAFALIEALGGWIAGSLALISDAGHMVTDAASFVVALIAATVTARRRRARFLRIRARRGDRGVRQRARDARAHRVDRRRSRSATADAGAGRRARR
jgi:hypothetical protein